MAQRKKRPTERKEKSATRRKARKPSKSARASPAKRIEARAAPRKRLAKAKGKPAAKKARKRVRVVKPPITPAVETGTEIEATEVREVSGAAEEPEESRLPLPDKRNHELRRQPALADDPLRAIKAR